MGVPPTPPVVLSAGGMRSTPLLLPAPQEWQLGFLVFLVSVYFVAPGEVCPGTSTAAEGPRSQPVSLRPRSGHSYGKGPSPKPRFPGRGGDGPPRRFCAALHTREAVTRPVSGGAAPSLPPPHGGLSSARWSPGVSPAPLAFRPKTRVPSPGAGRASRHDRLGWSGPSSCRSTSHGSQASVPVPACC